jgi:hypothetical protein
MEIHSNTQCIPFRKGGRDYSKKILDVFSPVAPGQLHLQLRSSPSTW